MQMTAKVRRTFKGLSFDLHSHEFIRCFYPNDFQAENGPYICLLQQERVQGSDQGFPLWLFAQLVTLRSRVQIRVSAQPGLCPIERHLRAEV